jgi:integrase
MPYYKENTLFKTKNNRLHIFQRKDAKTSNWYGRTFIEKKQIQTSSNTADKSKAIIILEQWFDRLHFKKSEGIQVHAKTFIQCAKEFIEFIKSDMSRAPISRSSIISRLNAILQYKIFHKLRIDKVNYDIIKDFLLWKNEQAQKKSKILSGKTLHGNLITISSFIKWCVEKKYRKEKLEKLTTKLLEKKFRQQRTQRTHFTRKEWQYLLSVSRDRIKKARGKRVSFDRRLLHEYMIFMVGTGLRVNEASGMKWEDTQMIDKHNLNPNLKNTFVDSFFGRLERYYTINNVFGKKRRANKNIGGGNSYFALEKILKLYKEYNIKVAPNTKIFLNRSIRDGLNNLLKDTDLKHTKIGEEFVKRDAKSFRHTHILFQIENGVPTTDIAKNLDTSTEMIDKFYTANVQTEELIDRLTKINRSQIKAVS